VASSAPAFVAPPPPPNALRPKGLFVCKDGHGFSRSLRGIRVREPSVFLSQTDEGLTRFRIPVRFFVASRGLANPLSLWECSALLKGFPNSVFPGCILPKMLVSSAFSLQALRRLSFRTRPELTDLGLHMTFLFHRLALKRCK